MGECSATLPCNCKKFTCVDDCKCPHKQNGSNKLEEILDEMLDLAGIGPNGANGSDMVFDERTECPNIDLEEPEDLQCELEDKYGEYEEPIIEEIFDTDEDVEPINIPQGRMSLGKSFNEGILAFNEYVRKIKASRKEESPPPGAKYPCRFEYEIHLDNQRQEEEKRFKQEKEFQFNEGVRRMVEEMEEIERNKPKVESPLPPPVYPCRFEREAYLWDERKEQEKQELAEKQQVFDQRAREVEIEMEKMKPKVKPISPPKPPKDEREVAYTVSSRKLREEAEAKTRELFSNENLRKYNQCWSKPYKPYVPESPVNKPPQRVEDLRRDEFSLYTNELDKKMARRFQNRIFYNFKKNRRCF